MCYAIPAKILEIKGETATVDYGGITKKANIGLIENPNIGDYVLIHAGFAIEKLEQKNAEQALEEIRNYVDEAEK